VPHGKSRGRNRINFVYFHKNDVDQQQCAIHTAATKIDDFKVEYLCDVKAIIKKALTSVSGA
jgi:hypothetical protein